MNLPLAITDYRSGLAPLAEAISAALKDPTIDDRRALLAAGNHCVAMKLCIEHALGGA